MLFKRFLLALSLVISFSLLWPMTQVMGQGGYIPASDYSIVGVQPGIVVDSVLQSLGNPTERYTGDYIHTKGGPFVKYNNKEIWYYKGISFAIADISLPPNNYGRRVALVLLLDRSATMPSGLAVGDSVQRMIDLYGLSFSGERNFHPLKPERFGSRKFMYDNAYYYRVKGAYTEWDDMKNVGIYTYKGRITAICLYTGY